MDSITIIQQSVAPLCCMNRIIPLKKNIWKTKPYKAQSALPHAICYLPGVGGMKSSAVLLVWYIFPALEGSVAICHIWSSDVFCFSFHSFWGIEKPCCMLSVTSCGYIYLALSHQCTMLYLHKKEECVCVCVWVCLVCLGQRLHSTACAAMNKTSSTSATGFASHSSLFCICFVLSHILRRCEGDTIKQAFQWQQLLRAHTNTFLLMFWIAEC